MGIIYCKFNDGHVRRVVPYFFVGDYVRIDDCGHQYDSYHAAYLYFWGENKHHYLSENDASQIWKVINIVMHANGRTLLYHIRNIKGDNSVVNDSAIKPSTHHMRNRCCAKNMLIYQLPYINNVMPHSWRDKLWDFYEEGKVVKNKRKLHNLKK